RQPQCAACGWSATRRKWTVTPRSPVGEWKPKCCGSLSAYGYPSRFSVVPLRQAGQIASPTKIGAWSSRGPAGVPPHVVVELVPGWYVVQALWYWAAMTNGLNVNTA